MSAEPDISIIIVNWRSVDFLRKCLQSIRANSENVSCETIVVDNASFDGCAEMLERGFPEIRFIQAQENLGFAKANNLAFQFSTGRNILFLNPDTEIVGDALAILVRAADSVPDAGAVGPKLLNSDHTLQMSVQAFPSILNQILDADYLRTKFPKSRLWGMSALFEDGNSPKPVDALSGACLMVRRALFEQVGRFTESYFMYAEDVDLCYKIKLVGWKRYYAGHALVVHHGGQSSSAREDKHFVNVLQRESRLRFFREHRGRLYASAYRGTVGMAAIVRLVALRLLTLTTLDKQRRARVRRAARKWQGIFRWSIGGERWARQLNEQAN